MSLVEDTLFGVRDKVAIAIDRIKTLCAGDQQVVVAFSGGKDSIVTLDLVRRSGIKHEAVMSVTGIDPPELTLYVKREYPEVKRVPPKKTMFQLIPSKLMPPTRVVRYCCYHLKESGNDDGKIVVTGIRWAESARRSKRQMSEACRNGKGQRFVHPIIDWSESDVWEYIRANNMPYCKLYDEGYKRIGCIGCPMSTAAAADLERYPCTKAAYLKAFERMIAERTSRGKSNRGWETPQDVMDWWLGNASIKSSEDTQVEMFCDG